MRDEEIGERVESDGVDRQRTDERAGPSAPALGGDELWRATRPAAVEDYASWLEGYAARGGRVELDASGDLEPLLDRWRVLERDVELAPLYGAAAVSLIVPAGIRCTGDAGHAELYFCDTFRTTARSVRSFADCPVPSHRVHSPES